MLLCIDTGNTNTVFSVWDGTKFLALWRISTDHRRTADEYAVLLAAFLRDRFGAGTACRSAVLSSVVPPMTPLFVRLLKECFAVEALVVGPGIRTGISIKTLNPAGVGAEA